MSAADRVLVAGIGNVFLGDDGFGVEVVRRIDPASLPARVDVADYGIRGLHLAYALVDGPYRTLVLVDAVSIEGPPGTLAVLEVDPDEHRPNVGIDAHAMTPDAVLGLLGTLGGAMERVVVVGCAPGWLGERMGLSEPVSAVLDEAVRLVTEVVGAEVGAARVNG